MHKVSDLEFGDLCHEVGQQRVGRDVERNPEENVSRTLVQLTAQLAIRHVELEERMTWRQSHLRKLPHIPCAHDVSSAIWVGPDGLDHLLDLVDMTTVWCRPRTPLVSVNRSQVALGVSPFIPDGDAVVVEPLDIGRPAQEPQQLAEDAAGMQLLGGKQRESFTQVETHLVTEHAARASASAVGLLHAMSKYVVYKVKVLSHPVPLSRVGKVRYTPYM